MDRIESLPRLTLWVVRLLSWVLGSVASLMALLALVLATGMVDDVIFSGLPAGSDPNAIRVALFKLLPLAACTIGFAAAFLVLLDRIVKSVGDGDPFILANAVRLRWMGVFAAVFQAMAILGAWVEQDFARAMGQAVPPFDLDIAGFVIALVLFVLAQVFERGAAMRDDLEGTV